MRLVLNVDQPGILHDSATQLLVNRNLTPSASEKVELAGAAAATPSLVWGAMPVYFVVGLVLGLSAAFLLEYMNTTIRTEYDVRRYVNLPVLGVVPMIREPGERLLIGAALKTPLGEIFNTVGAMVETAFKDTTSRVLMVASSNADEGKSTVACNLAVALARSGSRVLLVDCDLRKSVLHKMFSLPNETGISSYLQGATDSIDSAIVPSEVENLSLLPSGPHPENPVLLLRSDRFKAMVAELREKFDFVIIDSPPARIAVDTMVLAPLVDSVLLLLSASETRKDQATMAKRLIESAKGKVIGCVLNKATIHSRGYYYYYYDTYRYYDYGHK